MIRVLIVGDGDRDAAVLPHLVSRLLGVEVEPEHRAWRSIRIHRLFRGRGFDRKLRFVVREAHEAKRAVVAVVDQDRAKPRERLRALQEAREQDRAIGVRVATALGEARPHGESWLLDDEAAVRTGLHLPTEVKIPSTGAVKSPKDALQRLIDRSIAMGEPGRTVLACFEAVARCVDLTRCIRRDETGFSEVVDDLKTEFKDFILPLS